MRARFHYLLLATLALPGVLPAQTTVRDPQGAALLAVFQRDNGRLVCPPGAGLGLTQMKELFAPYARDIDIDADGSSQKLAKAVYAAFPCPFSPDRVELSPASKEDLPGTWAVPETSERLRIAPKLLEADSQKGLPPLRCEAVLFEPSGEYRYLQLRGQVACPTSAIFIQMKQFPRVSSWELAANGLVRITRTDVPSQVQEWEVHVVRIPFTFAAVDFAPGDLVAYLRFIPGNEIGASTEFRHLRRVN